MLERLGLGHPELARSNPRLVYCSINGFGQFSVYRHPPLLGEHTEEVFAEWLKS